MKKYYLKNILINITRRGRESAAICALAFFVVAFLSMTVFFGVSNQLEDTLLQHVDMNYIAAEKGGGSDLVQVEANRNAIDYYLYSADKLDQHGKDSANPYFLVQQIGTPAYIENETVKVLRDRDYFGNEYEYLDRNGHSFSVLNGNDLQNLTVTAGRLLDSQDEGKCRVIVPEDMMLYDLNGEVIREWTTLDGPVTEYPQARKVQIGDMITVRTLLKGQPKATLIECEVIGTYSGNGYNIYTDRKSFEQTVDSLTRAFLIDLWLAYSGKAEDLETYIDKYRSLLVTVSQINAEGMKQKLIKETKEITSLEGGTSYLVGQYLEVLKPDFGSLLVSVYRVKAFYRTVFAVSFAITLVMFAGMMIFILNRKKKEMSVYYSLGRSKTSLIIQYGLMYSLIALAGIVIGIAAGYFITQLLIGKIAAEDIIIQQRLLRYTGSDASGYKEIIPAVMSSAQIIRGVLISAAAGFGVINLTTAAVMMLILKGNNMRDKLAGGQ